MESVEILKNNTSEVVTLEESKDLFSGNREAYIGFEPSGLPHIAILIYVNKINEMVKLGFRVKVLLADWHARVNDIMKYLIFPYYAREIVVLPGQIWGNKDINNTREESHPEQIRCGNILHSYMTQSILYGSILE